MYVVKRDGRQETVHFNKITARLKKLCYGLNSYHCDPVLVAQNVCAGFYKGVTTNKLDELAAETAAAMTASHSDYACLASRIAVLNLHKNTKKSFSETKVMIPAFHILWLLSAICYQKSESQMQLDCLDHHILQQWNFFACPTTICSIERFIEESLKLKQSVAVNHIAMANFGLTMRMCEQDS